MKTKFREKLLPISLFAGFSVLLFVGYVVALTYPNVPGFSSTPGTIQQAFERMLANPSTWQVKDSAALGGIAASGYQKKLAAQCSGNDVVKSVDANGNPSCAPVTRTQACAWLPANAVWNSVSSIVQTRAGGTWSPTDVGTYNATASTTSCAFNCASGYAWSSGGSYTFTNWDGWQSTLSAELNWTTLKVTMLSNGLGPKDCSISNVALPYEHYYNGYECSISPGWSITLGYIKVTSSNIRFYGGKWWSGGSDYDSGLLPFSTSSACRPTSTDCSTVPTSKLTFTNGEIIYNNKPIWVCMAETWNGSNGSSCTLGDARFNDSDRFKLWAAWCKTKWYNCWKVDSWYTSNGMGDYYFYNPKAQTWNYYNEDTHVLLNRVFCWGDTPKYEVWDKTKLYWSDNSKAIASAYLTYDPVNNKIIGECANSCHVTNEISVITLDLNNGPLSKASNQNTQNQCSLSYSDNVATLTALTDCPTYSTTASHTIRYNTQTKSVEQNDGTYSLGPASVYWDKSVIPVFNY